MTAAIHISGSLEVWIGALLTLMVFSFLWRDNPFYKFAEHVFVGVSAAYWMVMGFWTTLWPGLIVKLVPAAERVVEPGIEPGAWDPTALIPAALGLLMLARLWPRLAWLGRWPTAFVLGTTAGYSLVRYLRSDFLYQIHATIDLGLMPEIDGAISPSATFAAVLVLIGTVSGLVYFLQTRRGGRVTGGVSRLGLLFLMVTFGAAFGSAVMGRIALLVGRFNELLGDWLGIL
jgi:hypothetical protein